ncbi:cupredoxin domain-containing protein [Candidatus Uhrbacteria bacterium]|nr:cupredoxin domain-containing protein [Candidatus Uhrbacteria bacterium]
MTISMKSLLVRVFAFFASISLLLPAVPVRAASTISLSQLQSGMLIRGTSRSAVYYYGADGFRYVFVNDKTYFTWYNNFNDVNWLTDADLGTIQIGGNVTYRPGSRMIKIDTDPKVYAIGRGGSLHWVSTEAVAIALFGSTWNKQIDDVPDGFFSNYTRSSDVTDSSQYNTASVKASVPDINTDKDLKAPVVMNISAGGYTPILATIQAGRTVRFTNLDTVNHTVTSDDLSWGSGTMSAGIVFSRTFKTPGTYTFFDSYHPQFTGTIIVQ